MLPSFYRLPRQNIPDVLRFGAHARLDGIELIYKKTEGSPRVTFIVSTKVDKRATVRNRIRRILSESVRHMLVSTRGCEAVVMARANIADMKQGEAQKLVEALFGKAGLLR